MTETILVLDDNEAARAVFIDLFEMEGFEVAAFAKPVVALAKLPDVKPVAFVLDYHLPRMNGVAFARSASEVDETFPKAPFIFVTGDSTVAEEADVSFLSNAHIMLKPANLDEVLAVVRDR